MTQVRVRGETSTSRSQEATLLNALARHLGLQYKQFPKCSGKYRIDGCLVDVGMRIGAWAEAKWYPTRNPYLAMNVPKYLELLALSERFSVPAYFVFRIPGEWGYCSVEDIKEIKWAGGTPAHREANDDDFEPLVFFDKTKVKWPARTYSKELER